MTHREKIELLRGTIEQLYVNEGRSKNYISKLLEVDRKVLTDVLNNDWELIQGKVHRLKPSNQKFLNRHRAFIKSELDNDVPMTQIAKQLNVSRDYLGKTIIPADGVLVKAREDYHKRRSYVKPPTYNTQINEINGEVWQHIMGYDNYQVSNLGRVKSNTVGESNIWYEIKPNVNCNTGRYYIHLYKNSKRKALSLPRVVGHTFVPGYSDINNTINHIDGDVSNNKADNLEWISQSENNKHAYDTLGKKPVIAYQTTGKFKKIQYKQYEFKTIRAFGKFLGVSESQAHRYIEQGKATLIY